MKSATKLAQLLNQRRPKGHRWTGLLGDFDGNVTSDRPGEVYVRLRQAGAGYALGSFPVRGGIREYYNLPVTVEMDPLTGEQFVAGVDEAGLMYGVQSGNDPPPATYLETHAATHEWRAEADDQLQWLHTLQIYSLRVQPTSTAQTVYVQPGVYYAAGAYRWLQTGITVDLSAYYPLTSYKWILLYVDEFRAVGIVDNSALDLPDVGETPAGTYALAALKLTAGASIAWLTEIVDLRFMPQNPGFTFLSLSDTPADYSGAGEYLVRVTTAEDGLEFITPTTALDGIVLMAATWAVYAKTNAGLAAALAAAASGDALLVPPGTYTADITIPEGVSVMGVTGVTFTGMVTMSAGSRLDGVIIDRDASSGALYGVYTDVAVGETAYLSHCVIDVLMDGGSAAAGLYVEGTGLLVAQDCTINVAGEDWARGVLLDPAYPAGTLEGYDVDLAITVAEDDPIDDALDIPPGNYLSRTLRVYPTAIGDYLYFSVLYVGQVCADTDWGDGATPLRITCTASVGGISSYTDEVQFLDEDGAWVSSTQRLHLVHVDVDCLNVANQRIYARVKRTVDEPSGYAQFVVGAYLGRSLTDGTLYVAEAWHQNDFPGVRLIDCAIKATSWPLHAVSGVIQVEGTMYDAAAAHGEIETLPGDRAAWDVINHDTFHASDIDVDYGDGEETYRHLPEASEDVLPVGTADGRWHAVAWDDVVAPFRWANGNIATAYTVLTGVASVVTVLYAVYAITGADTEGGIETLAPGDSVDIYDDGTDVLTLAVSAGGDVTVEPTAGADTFNVSLLFAAY